MKKLLIVLLSLGLAFGASAQRGHGGGGHVVYYRSAPRVVVGIGAYSPFYNPYYFGWGYPFGYYPYGYPYNYYGYRHDSKLDLQIEDIRNDYQHQIKDVRHDKSIPRSERKAKIRDLKYQRDKEITEAKRDYYERRTRPRNNNGTNNSQPQQQQGPKSEG